MFCLSVCLLLFFSYGHSEQTRSLLLLDLYNSAVDVQSVTLIIGLIHGQRIFFHITDCRSEGVVHANTLKKLVRKRNVPGGFPGVLPFRPTYRLARLYE